MQQGRPAAQSNRPQAQQQSVPGTPQRQYFINPYNFVPLHTRRDRGDGPPAPQGSWHDGQFSGHITIKMTTETPLLTVRRERLASTDKSGLLTVRTTPDGSPAINGSSVKGMLRSLFEQATGSRLGVFGHDKRLSYRRSADDARNLKLAKVVRNGSGVFELEIMNGVRASSHCSAQPVWAETATLASYEFGAEVFMWIELLENGPREAWFPQTIGRTRADADITTPSMFINMPAGWSPADAPQLLVKARIHNTGHTIAGKKYERIFVEDILDADPAHTHIGGLLSTTLATMKDDDRKALQKDWSAQIDAMSGDPATDSSGNKLDIAPYADKTTRDSWKALRPGQTLFVEMSAGRVVGMHPGMITRAMRKVSPEDLVPPQFRPAESEREMSPADRVFGWVSGKATEGRSAYRGLLAVGGVRCITDDPIAWFAAAVRVATLSTPKETQFRFYTRLKTQDPTQQPGPIGQTVPISEAFDKDKHVIAGHKVYPHHGLPSEYWKPLGHTWSPGEQPNDNQAHPTSDNRTLDYLAPNGTKNQVSSDLDSWVKPGVTFETRLRFTNLSADDLGALLWILNLEGHHRLGLGKPLGFGSLDVQVDWGRTAIRNHAQLLERYRGAGEGATQSHDELQALREKFDEDFRTSQPAAYWAMIKSIAGYSGDLPVFYPRAGDARPQSESFHWFVTNERGTSKQGDVGPREALPNLTNGNDPKLPILPKRQARD